MRILTALLVTGMMVSGGGIASAKKHAKPAHKAAKSAKSHAGRNTPSYVEPPAPNEKEQVVAAAPARRASGASSYRPAVYVPQGTNPPSALARFASTPVSPNQPMSMSNQAEDDEVPGSKNKR